MLRTTLRFTCVLAFGLAGSLVLAQEFSADIVNLKRESGGMSKIYVGKDKVRMESQDRQGGPGAFIIDEAKNTRVALMPDKHMYMDFGQMPMLPLAFSFWRPTDANDACSQWLKIAEQMKTRNKVSNCTKVGSDSVNGRSAVKYQGTSTDGKTTYVWVDTKLRFVVKTEGADSGMEMRNIQEASQPASMFEIPAGYTKFDMGSMMKQPQ